MSLIGNERIKLTANLLNTVAAAFLVTGGVAPLVAQSYDLPGPAGGWQSLGFTAIWILVGIGIHLMARRLLKGLKP